MRYQMNWAVALTLLFSALCFQGAQAQDDDYGDGGSTYSAQAHNYNVRFAPLGLPIGYVNIDADMAVTPNITAGPTVSFISLESGGNEFSTTAFGARGNYYFEGVFTDGWYASSWLTYGKTTASVRSTDGTESLDGEYGGMTLAAVGGYHWFWDNFNLNLGAGFSSFLGDGSFEVTDPVEGTRQVDVPSGTGFTIDFMMGFAF